MRVSRKRTAVFSLAAAAASLFFPTTVFPTQFIRPFEPCKETTPHNIRPRSQWEYGESGTVLGPKPLELLDWYMAREGRDRAQEVSEDHVAFIGNTWLRDVLIILDGEGKRVGACNGCTGAIVYRDAPDHIGAIKGKIGRHWFSPFLLKLPKPLFDSMVKPSPSRFAVFELGGRPFVVVSMARPILRDKALDPSPGTQQKRPLTEGVDFEIYAAVALEMPDFERFALSQAEGDPEKEQQAREFLASFQEKWSACLSRPDP